jgi:hypothetical protein
MAKDIRTIFKGVADGNITLKEAESSITSIVKASDTMADSISSLGSAFETFSNLSIKNTKTLEGSLTSFKQLTAAASQFKDTIISISKLGSVVGLDVAFKAAIEPISAVSGIMTNLVEAAANVVGALDGMDAGTRELNDSQFKLAANIGLGFDQAKKFSEIYKDIVKSNSDLAGTGFYIKADQFQAATAALQQQGFAMTELAERSSVAGKSLNNVQAMTMQARAMGMDVGEYSKKMGDMVRKSGLSMEDSMKLMASAQDIAGDTGLRVDEVTQSLDNATNGFQRMGTTINFGMPVLRGFAASITDVGLGISQAADLAGDFSKSLMGIVNNPALAYVTSMKGGLSGGMGGGGGVLNPSIQMQAMMMDQSPDSQAELAKNLSVGMRETLKSFSGGDIISVKQAAESPELQTKFYTQQQMLGSQFGISDTATQNRVLEYLQKLEEATYSGDGEAAAILEKQIAEAAKGNDQTMSIQEKMSLAMDKSVILAQEQLANQKGILAATMMGVKNKTGKEGEDAFVANFGKALSDIERLFGGNKDISSMTPEQLATYNKDRMDLSESLSSKYVAAKQQVAGVAPDTGGAGGGGAALGGANVATTAGQTTVTLIVDNRNRSDVTLSKGSTAAAPRIVPKP